MSEELRDWLYGRLPQVGSIPSGWRLVQLTDVARLESGHTPSRAVPSYWNGNIQWLSLHDTSQLENHVVSKTRYTITPAGIANSSARLLPAGTVALSRTATVGKCVILGREMATTQDFACYVPGQSLASKYLMHLFRFMQPVWRALSGGSTHQTVYMPVFEQLRVLLPPLLEQQKIAEILDTVDEAIRKTDQIIAKLKQVKQGLLHDLLTRGIDDNGELRDPERHPKQFKDSPLGRIPKAWKLVPLNDLSDTVTSGSRGWAAHYAEQGALFVRIGNLTRAHINLRLDNAQFVTPPSDSEGKRTMLVDGDILISITADLGIVGVVPPNLGEAYVNQHIALVRLSDERANSRWVAHFLASHAGQQQIRALDDSGAKAGLNLPTVRRLLVALPTRQEQDQLAGIIDATDVRVAREENQRKKLIFLKAGLMEDLLTGRVRTTNLEPSP